MMPSVMPFWADALQSDVPAAFISMNREPRLYTSTSFESRQGTRPAVIFPH